MKHPTVLFTKPSRFTIICSVIVLFAFFSRVIRIGFPQSFFFDEVYHGFTATTYLHNDPKGYEFWQSPPEGVAYEWTHPPLAKVLMAASMLIFGENSIGWRMSSVFFGTGAIVLTGLLAHALFKNEKITIISLLLMSFDGLYLTMSRIAMNDMHFVFFTLLGVVFYLEWKKSIFDVNKSVQHTLGYAVFCSLALGLALASKWTTLYAGAGLALDIICTLLYRWNLPFKKLISSICIGTLLVAGVYLGSYLQFFLQGHTLTQWKDTTQQMWWYHTGLVATHTYQSRPWQWVLDMRPVWMHVDYTQASSGKLANIYNVANPLFFWIGALCAGVFSLITAQKLARNMTIFLLGTKARYTSIPWERSFVLTMYLILWVPWILSPRIMFFYHYAPAVPFLAILTAYSLTTFIKNHPNGQKIVSIFLVFVGLAYLILYPLNTGLFMPTAYFDTIFNLFPMWR